MKLLSFLISFWIFIPFSFSEERVEKEADFIGVEQLKKEIDLLKIKVKELEEIQNESNLAIRGLFKDSFLGKKSKSYLRLGYGLTSFSPDEIEEDNDRALRSVNGEARWGNFEIGYFLDLSIGKKIILRNNKYVSIAIGYQHWQSQKIDGSFTSGSTNYQFEEKVKAGTLFVRASLLTEIISNHQIGGGLSAGYTPTASINYSISQGSTGVTATGEGDGILIEPFAIYELSLSNHFTGFARAGYRLHNVKNVTLNVADIITQTSTIDIDMSGVFGSLGLSIDF